MVWTNSNTVSFSQSEDGIYKLITRPAASGTIVYALSIEAQGSPAVARRRAGFMVPYALVEGAFLCLPSEELVYSPSAENLTRQYLSWSTISNQSSLAARVTSYGVMVAPDRGAYPSTVRLWRLT